MEWFKYFIITIDEFYMFLTQNTRDKQYASVKEI